MLSGGKSLCLSFRRASTTGPKPPGAALDVVAVRREKHGVVVESEVRFGWHTLRFWPRDPEGMFVALEALKRLR